MQHASEEDLETGADDLLWK